MNLSKKLSYISFKSYRVEVNGEAVACVSVRLYVYNIAPSVFAVRLSRQCILTEQFFQGGINKLLHLTVHDDCEENSV
jgi:hypothetical protein